MQSDRHIDTLQSPIQRTLDLGHPGKEMLTEQAVRFRLRTDGIGVEILRVRQQLAHTGGERLGADLQPYLALIGAHWDQRKRALPTS